jgi:formate dehydrogenase subunit gamma
LSTVADPTTGALVDPAPVAPAVVADAQPAHRGPRYVRRFTRTERSLHWLHAAAFFVLLGSGLVLYLPPLSTAVGRRPLVKDVHWWTAVAWAGAMILVAVLGNRRAVLRVAREVDTFDADDRRFLRGNLRAPQGRFNAGQKVNVILTAAFAVLFAVSGALLWLGERNHAFRLGGTVFLHDALMYVSLVVLVGHLYLAVIYPRTRHAMRGITLGMVREDWAREHHAKWVAQLDAEPAQRDRPRD